MARDLLKPVPRFSKKVLGTKLNHDNFHGTIFMHIQQLFKNLSRSIMSEVSVNEDSH